MATDRVRLSLYLPANVRCTQARKTTHGLDDNIKAWTGLSVEESIRMTEDRDKWRKYVHGVANPWIEDG